MIELWTVDGWGAFIRLRNPGPFSHYWINNETTFWNDPPKWPWAAHHFPLNFYASAIAPKPGQQLLPSISKCHVGAQHRIPPLWSTEGRRWNGDGVRGWQRQEEREREVEGEQGEYEYWMFNVISFICARVDTVKIHWQRRFTRGPAGRIALQPAHLTEWADSVHCLI